MPKRLLLASASPARKATLISAGITPIVAVADVDEDGLLAANPGLPAAGQVELLATAKARAIANQLGSPAGLAAVRPSVVVGCDSMLEMDGQIVGKPHTAEVARERLRAMSGRHGDLHTGHCVIDMQSGEMAVGTSCATVYICELSEAEIEAYIATGEPLVVAGSFTIDGYGGPFIEKIEGDHHGVVGISLPLLRRLLSDLGHSITEFWDER
ncbi:septum formation protein [Trueperella bonasi]|uniref:Nucleoside triphosphate pyrophosphatase n=1 Tax=Trueperella bonasi TaxID=312286 RepID=A0ABT9NFR0_9ACTO|nr:nucleoside triphosphate pyrophosphatase [Trueperella bonasi]MDP9806040.1 septum formation protein [Trueperella bonasi]